LQEAQPHTFTENTELQASFKRACEQGNVEKLRTLLFGCPTLASSVSVQMLDLAKYPPEIWQFLLVENFAISEMSITFALSLLKCSDQGAYMEMLRRCNRQGRIYDQLRLDLVLPRRR